MPRAEIGEMERYCSKVKSFGYAGYVSSEDLIYSMVTIANNSVLYTQNLLRVNLKCPYHMHTQMVTEGDGSTYWLHHGNHFTMYIKASCPAP